MKRLTSALVIGSLIASGFAPVATRADDIDLYTGGEASTGIASNVLIVLDNSTNWAAASQHWATGKQGESELEAMSEIAGTLTDSINVGLLMSAGSNGGYVRFAVREMNPTNRTQFQSMLNTMKANFGNDGDNDDKVNTASIVYDNMMNTSYRYFNSFARFGTTDLPSGSALDLRDYNGNSNSATKQPAFPNALGSYSLSSSTATTYTGPSTAKDGCTKNYIIFIGNGYPNSAGAASDLTAAATLAGISDASITTQVTGGDNSRYADEWAKFMYTYGVKSTVDDPKSTTTPKAKLTNRISTYTIDVCKDACDASQATLLKSMAKQGGGKYFKSTSKDEIKTALATIFAEIQAVNSVFASATLPISVNTQGTYENQVYIGVFRPDGSARPRWFGNLKEYKFGRYCDIDNSETVLIDSTRALPLTGTYTATDERVADDVAAPDCGKDSSGVQRPVKLYLADQNGYRAIDETGNTGFIDLSAQSYWSSSSSYWSFMPTDSGSTSDSPDGPSVERGGAGQKLRATWAATPTSPHPDGRKIFTCLGNCLSSSATTAQKTLSNNTFTTSNSDVTTALAAPSGASSVTLARSGNTVTGTATASHGFNPGDTVVIAGATPTAYNGTVTLLTASGTTFTYALSETPSTSETVTAATSGATTVTTGSLSTTTAGSTATVTVQSPNNLTNGAMTATIALTTSTGSSALDAVLQGVKTGTVTGNKFTYTAALPSNPSATLSGTATVKCGTNAAETATGTWSSATGKFTFTNSPSGNFTGCKNFSGSVVVSGAADTKYNGTWTIASTDKGTSSFAAGTLAAATAVSSSYNLSITQQGTSYAGAALTRSLGSQTVTVTIAGGATHTIPVSSTVTISGATDTSYNANWTVATVAADAKSFTFTGPAMGPTTPPTGTITATSTSATGTGPTTANLVNWLRGKDLWEDENLDGALTDVRASIHGDVLHARPVMINYGGTLGIVGYYGSNDGFLRAIAAGSGKSTEPSTRTDSYTDDGNEKWAFIPSEFMSYSKLSRIYSNASASSSTSLVRYPNQSCSLPTAPKGRDYFWDGPITAYQSCFPYNATTCPSAVKYPDATTGPYSRAEKTWIFAGMRRGGRALYALDVSDPDAPKFMWRITNASTGFSELGQTWSEPKVTKLKGTFTRSSGATVTNPLVLIFGAGYDPTVDDQPTGTARTNTMGRGVFVVDAETGEKIALLQAPSGVTQYSIPADVNVLDIDGDGYVDRIYAGDTNANILRWDVVSSVTDVGSSSYWKTYRIAQLGDTTNAGGSNARRVMFAPEVLPFKEGGVSKVWVFVGTGDREKPLPNLNSSGGEKRTPEGCSTYFDTGSSPYAIKGTYSGTSYIYYGKRISDYFFGVLDTNQTGATESTVNGSPIQLTNLLYTNQDSNVLKQFNSATGYDASCTSSCTAYNGWRIRLKNDPDAAGATRGEEKSVNAAKVVGGTVYFATNTPVDPQPSAGICSNLGEALGYAVDPFTGLPAFNRDNSTSGGTATYTGTDYATKFSGGGLPPTVTAGVVTVGGSPYRFIIGSGGSAMTSSSSVGGQRNILNLRGIRSRLYWSYGADN